MGFMQSLKEKWEENKPEIEDKNLLYPLIIIFGAYTFLWLALIVDTSYFTAMGLFIGIGSFLGYADYNANLKEAVGKPRFILDFNLEDEEIEEADEEIDEYKKIFGMIGKPKLFKISEKMLEHALNNSNIVDKIEKMRDKIKQLNNPDSRFIFEPDTRNIAEIRREIIDLKDEHINYSDYELNYFLEPKLENFFNKKALNVLKNKFKITCKNDILELINPENYVIADPDDGMDLRKAINEKINDIEHELKTEVQDATIDLKQIICWIKHDFETFITKKEMKFYSSLGIKNFDHLLNRNIEDLEYQFNKRFSKTPRFKNLNWIPLGKYILEMKNQLKEKLGVLTFELETKTDMMDFFNLQAVPLFFYFHRYFLYGVKWDKKFEIPIHDKEDQVFYSKKMVIILPRPWEESIIYKKRRLTYKGFQYGIPTTEKLELVFFCMYRADIPVYFCNSCSYLRKRIKEEVNIDKDAILLRLIEGLQGELSERQKDIEKIIKQYHEDQNEIDKLLHVIQIKEMNNLANEDVERKFNQKKKEIKWVLSPPKTEIKLYWFILIVMLICGIFIGIGIMNWWFTSQATKAITENQELQDPDVLSLFLGVFRW